MAARLEKQRCNGNEGDLDYELFFGKGHVNFTLWKLRANSKNVGFDLILMIMIGMMVILVMLMIDMIILGFGGSSISWQLQLKT